MENDFDDACDGELPTTMELPCPLKNEELLAKGHELSERLCAIALLEEEKKATATRIKEQVEKFAGQARTLAQQIRTKTELRAVDVRVERDEVAGQIVFVRLDTGAAVSTRPMTPGERQMPLALPTRTRAKRTHADAAAADAE